MNATDRPSENRILVWMCVLIGVNQLGFGAIVPTISLYAQSFGVSVTAIGGAVAIYGLARLVGAPTAGNLADKFGRRHSLALGGVVTAIGNLICAVATDYTVFMIGRFIAGAGAGLVLTTGQIVLADISTPERRGRMISIYQGTFLFAVGVGPFPGGLLADNLGLAAPFYAYAIFGLICTGVAWLAVGETKGFGEVRDGKPPGPKTPYVSQLGILAKKRGYVLVCLVSLMFAVIRTGGFFAIIPLLGSVDLGLSQTQIGLGMFLGALAGLVASYPGGMVADRFGRKAVIVPASIVTAGTMAIFAYAAGYPLFMAACIIWGISTSVGGSAPAAYAADNAPKGMNATTMSTFRMVGDVGYVVGPLMLGAIADGYGSVTALIAGAVMMAVTAIVFGLGAPETWKGRKSEPERKAMRLMDVAKVARSKNAGPLNLTFDIMFETEADYERGLAAEGLKAEAVARTYGVSANAVRVIPYPTALAIKITIPRHEAAGGPRDRDVYGAQQHVGLLEVEL